MTPEDIKKHRLIDLVIAVNLFVFSVLLRASNYTELSVYTDELTYSFYSFSILAHNWCWPTEFMRMQPPLVPYLMAMITYLFGGSLEVLRIVSIFFSSMTIVVIYFLGKELFNRRVGFLSAILICFCSYHIIYGKVIMLESTVMFFIFLFLYFFWKVYNEEKLRYAIAAGIFLGLANDTKWIGLLLYPVVILFILWTKKNWKCVFNKKVLTMFLVSFLVFLPVLLDLYIHHVDPFFYLLFGKFKGGDYAGYKSYSFIELLIHGFDNYIDMMIDVNNPVTSSISWLPAYQLAASFLLIFTLLYFLYYTLKGKNNASLLFIFFMVFNIFVAFYKLRFNYYLLWAFPAFLIMLSNISVDFVKKIKVKSKSDSTFSANLIKILFLFFLSIYIFSSISVGVFSPYNESLFVGYEKQMMKIKSNIQPGESITTDSTMIPLIYFYLDKNCFDVEQCNILILPLYKKTVFRQRIRRNVDLEMLDIVKPRYIIISIYYHSAYADRSDEIKIRENYNLISNEDNVLLYERKM